MTADRRGRRIAAAISEVVLARAADLGHDPERLAAELHSGVTRCIVTERGALLELSLAGETAADLGAVPRLSVATANDRALADFS